MKLLKCFGVLVFSIALCGFIALAGGSEWGTPSMGWKLACGIWLASFIIFSMKLEDLL